MIAAAPFRWMMQAQNGWRWMEAINWPMVLLTLALCSFGLIMVTSSSMPFAESKFGDPWFFGKRYFLYWVMGMGVAIVVASVPVSFWERYGILLMFAALFLLVLVLIPGVGRRINGSQRWLSAGPISLQASELVKFCVIIFFSSYLARRGAEMLEDWRGVLKPLLILATIVFLLLLEPDFGASVVMVGTVMAMLFIAGVRVWQFVLLFLCTLGGLIVIAQQSSYRVQRLKTFLDPWAEMYDGGYQLTQSLIAFGRGEWFGLGLGNSVQKMHFLPEAHTDFITAIIAEELGLAGLFVLVALFAGLLVCIFGITRRAVERGHHFSAFASFGIATMFAGQAFINVGVASGFLPTKGLTLPFISYGGSSLWACLVLVALLLRIDWELAKDAVSVKKAIRSTPSRQREVHA